VEGLHTAEQVVNRPEGQAVKLLSQYPVMAIRGALVTLVGFCALLGGCSKDTPPAPPATPTVSAEDQIREVLTAATEATSTLDSAKMADLTCAKLRDRASSFTDLVPPISTFPQEAVASIGAEQFAQNLGEQFTGASPESLRAAADAVIANDEAAYVPAMKDVLKNSMQFRLDSVDNIVVTGDTATADVTVTVTVGAQPSRTETDQAQLVTEDGQWKDCTVSEISG
jgi:hypothetical protein